MIWQPMPSDFTVGAAAPSRCSSGLVFGKIVEGPDERNAPFVAARVGGISELGSW